MQQNQEEQGNVIHMGNKIVVIVDEPSFSFESMYKGLSSAQEEAHSTLIQRLAEYLPDFFNPDVVKFDNKQCTNLAHAIYYKIHQDLGFVRAEVKVMSGLLDWDIYSNTILLLMHQHTELQKYRTQLEGKKGVVISGDYHLGDDKKKDTRLCFNDDISEDGLNSLLNVLCYDKKVCDNGKVTKNEIMKKLGLVYFEPFRHMSGYHAFAHMSDMTLRGIKAADKPVGEFMRWLKENKLGVQTAAELLGEARIKYNQALDYRKLVDAKQIDETLQNMAERTGDEYLSMANEIIERLNLRPPVNNRMDYLVR